MPHELRRTLSLLADLTNLTDPAAESLAVKTTSYIQFKKTALDAKSNDVGVVKSLEVDRMDRWETSYLHKKFKKVAEVINYVEPPVKPLNGLLTCTDVPKTDEETPVLQPGRHVCPYCQLVCAKPSVLQKHVRAHTNERPYPCSPCGFAFKTKSNLYKHCRSQAHRIKTGMGFNCDSTGSDLSDESNNSAEVYESKPEDPQPKIYKPKFHKAAFYQDEPKITHESIDEPDKSKIPSPTSDILQQRISKIIRDNQVIFETMEPHFSKKYLQRQNSREKEIPSPKSDLESRRNHETKSKLALALLKVDRVERSYSPSYPKVNFDNLTYQPLNLTKKPKVVTEKSMIKEILIASRDTESKPERMAEILNTFHIPQPAMEHDVGPLLGSTPLVDAPIAKKRRVQSTTVPPEPRGLALLANRRLSTSSLPSTLKSLEELSRHPLKQPSVHMFGGEVKIMDCGEPKTIRIARSPENHGPDDGRIVTVAKTGLHSSGGTLVSSSAPDFHMTNILSPDTTGFTIAPNVVTPNLTVPGVPQPESGILIIKHGEKTIPFVPGIPGPQSLMSEPPRRKDMKPNVSSLAAVRKHSSSSHKQQNVPNDVPKIEISSAPAEERPAERKFLRPTSLPLKPGSFTPKRLHQGTTPTVLSLVSPETPRPKKSYGQLFLNGHAYTYLGLKCSTRSYYCTISRPQPMYVLQSPQRPRLSMYSNWKVYSEADPLGVTPGDAMGQYNSKYRTGGYTVADSRQKGCETTITHSPSWKGKNAEDDSKVVLQPEKTAHEEDVKRQSKEVSVEIISEGTAKGEVADLKRVIVTIPSEPCDDETDQRVAGALSKTHDASLKAEFFPPASGPNQSYVSVTEDGRSICVICNKTFSKPSQLRLHVNIHYFERPFRCESCAVSFRTKGHLQKHERSVSHHNKVSMNTTFGTATTTNPRPFKCDDCKIAFRIHGHLAKHLRSKLHIMKLECIGKLPFGTYAELERSGYNLNEIDTTDCDNSLESLQALAQKLYEKDASKFGQPITEGKPLEDSAADSDSSSSEGLHTEQLQCAVCSEQCDSPAALQVHMFADHNREMVLDKRKSEDYSICNKMSTEIPLVFSKIDPFRAAKSSTETIKYGTAGFRSNADGLDFVVYRMGLLATLRSKSVGGQVIGLMITASHNPEQDNGVKLVDPKGEMLAGSWEDVATRVANSDYADLAVVLEDIIKNLNIDWGKKATVFIGRDTRPSSLELCEGAKSAIEAIGGDLIDCGVVTTPMLHFFVAEANAKGSLVPPSNDDYYLKLATAFKNLNNAPVKGNYKPLIHYDGANGVGAGAMQSLYEKLGDSLRVDIFNTGSGRLNYMCGSDFVKVNMRVPDGVPIEADVRSVAVDGDADRLIYFYLDKKRAIHILDGDRIATLLADYLVQLVRTSGISLNIGLVQTAYANGASTQYISQVLKMPLACTETGVKHLHHKALEFDIGVYFEANGHGTVVYSDKAKSLVQAATENQDANDDVKTAAKKLWGMIELTNEAVGDALSDLLLVETVLRAKGWSAEDWEKCYADLPSRLLKVMIQDRDVITTTDAARRCVTPLGLQEEIDVIVSSYENGRAFVRASGTEDVVRIYAEAITQEAADQLGAKVALAVYNSANGIGEPPVIPS